MDLVAQENKRLGEVGIGQGFIYNGKEYVLLIPSYQGMFLENMVDVRCCDDNKNYKLSPDTMVKVKELNKDESI